VQEEGSGGAEANPPIKINRGQPYGQDSYILTVGLTYFSAPRAFMIHNPHIRDSVPVITRCDELNMRPWPRRSPTLDLIVMDVSPAFPEHGPPNT
jgi:hypothetical protein